MKRFALALSAIVVGVVVSSCAVGVRQPATDITDTSAVLNGKVLSTTGGPGSWYIEYGPTEARTERTPTRDIDFVVNESEPVSEPVDGLEPATTYHYAVCAEDSDNPGDPFCSPDATLFTGDSVVGEAAQLGTFCPALPPGSTCPEFALTVEAGSDADGASTSGTVSVGSGVSSRGASFITGDVTCLSVSGQVAVIGALGQHSGAFENDFFPASVVLRVTDGGAPSSSQDSWEVLDSDGGPEEPPPPAPTNCPAYLDDPPAPSPKVNDQGDLQVTDVQALQPTDR